MRRRHLDILTADDLTEADVNQLTNAEKLDIVEEFLTMTRGEDTCPGYGFGCCWSRGTLFVARYDPNVVYTVIDTYSKTELLRWFNKAKMYKYAPHRLNYEPHDMPVDWNEAFSETEYLYQAKPKKAA